MKIFHFNRLQWRTATALVVGYFISKESLNLLLFHLSDLIDHSKYPELRTWSGYASPTIVDLLLMFLILYFSSRIVFYEKRLLKDEFSIPYFMMAVILGIFIVYLQKPLYLFYKLLPEVKYFYSPNRVLFEPKLSIIPHAISTIIIIPIAEEIFFRKILFSKLLERYGVLFSILFSSLLFAIVHLPDIYQFYTAILGGIIACVLLQTTNNIQYSIIFHMTWSAIVFFS